MGAFTNLGSENVMRWDRRSRRFLEVWYATFNHRDSGCGLWLRYTLTSPVRSLGDPYCELWAFLFDPSTGPVFAGKERYPIDRLGIGGRDDGAIVRIGDAFLTESHLEGEVHSGDDSLAWSLDFEPADRCFHHLPPRLSERVERRVSTVCSPNLAVPVTGAVKVRGTALEFDGDPGCQSHRWGRAHSSTWAWAHCSLFDHDEPAIFEAVSAKASFGPVPAPTLTFAYLRLDDEDLLFNDLKWALRARSSYEMPTWAFSTHNDRWKVVGGSRVIPDRLVQVAYSDPNGSARYCANSEVADLALEVYRREEGAWRHERSLTAVHTAHLEFGRREPFPELPVAL